MSGAGLRYRARREERFALARTNRRVSESGYRQPPASMARSRGNRDLPLPKPFKGAILASNGREAGECRDKGASMWIRLTEPAPNSLRAGVVLLLCSMLSAFTLQAQERPVETPPQDTIVKIVDDVSISLTQPWKRSGVTFTNATELVRFASDDERRQIGRIIMYAEHRTDHKEAVRRLAEITAGPKNAGLEFFPASGWPAVERWYLAPLPVRGENEPTTLTGSDERALWLTLAIAYRDLVIRLEATFVPDPDPRIAKEVRDAGRAMKLPQRLDVKGSEQELLSLERGDFAPFVRLETTTERGVALLRPKGAAPQLSLAPNGFSEIELAASANGQRVVIASNGGGLSFSTDSGATLSSGALTLGFPVNGDPSVAWGPSGTFYHAQIGFPDGTTAAGGVTGCSTVISASTTLSGAGGFSFRAHATFCPSTGGGMCFPDQEHIAADRTNAAPGGDQVYSVWRHFTPLFGAPSCPVITGVPRPSISCSAASGVSWTQPTFIGNGDIPRVTVGSDGFVYVVYTFFGSININKFSSCSAGLVPQRGFPVLIDAVAFGDCPAGLDRCGESVLVSPMVAVDDTNPARVFVAYAKSSSRTNDDILLKDSVDAGATWSGAALSVSAPSVSARRFMPWVCTTNGTAWVSWYDRRSATAGAPDLTEYFLGGAYRKGAAWVVEPQRNLSGGMPDPQMHTRFHSLWRPRCIGGGRMPCPAANCWRVQGWVWWWQSHSMRL